MWKGWGVGGVGISADFTYFYSMLENFFKGVENLKKKMFPRGCDFTTFFTDVGDCSI